MKQKRTAIGVLICNLDDDYRHQIWNGVESAAKMHDIDVIFVGSGSIGSPYDNDRKRNYIYELIKPGSFDGLVVVSTTIADYIGFPAMAESFRDLFASFPVVNIGPEYPGMSSVSVDNASGIREVVFHLAEVHGKKRPVYVGGLEKSIDGIARKRAFIGAIAACGIEPAENGILTGNFHYEQTREAFGKWLDQGHPFDSVVAASDAMASACYDELRLRGFRIPDDIAVTGFDDIESSRFHETPMTTVLQPVSDLSFAAVQLLLSMIGGSPCENLMIPTRAVIRQSCGCHSPEVRYATGSFFAEGAARSPSLAAIPAPTPAEFGEDAESALALSLSRAAADPSASPAFLSKFQEILRNTSRDSRSVNEVENLVSRLERNLWKGLGEKGECREGMRTCEALLHQSRILLKERAESFHSVKFLEYYTLSRRSQYVIAAMISSFSLKQLLLELGQSLPSLGIGSCLLSLFVPGSNNRRSLLVLGYHDGKDLGVGEAGIEFDSADFFPRSLIPESERFNLFVEVLFHEDEYLGLIVMNINPSDGVLSDALTSQIRSALRASLLRDEIQEKDARLNAAFGQLNARAIELESANSRIRESQARLLASEKMASLGRLTAGIAHEMNTPLAAVRASLAEMEQLVAEYRESAGDPEVSADDHRAIAGDMDKSIDLAIRSTERAASFIRSIKGQTRESGQGAPGVAFDAVKTVRETLVLLAHALKSGNCRADFREPGAPVTVYGRSDRLVQVITNLVINAIDAMAPLGGTVGISLSSGDGAVVLSVADTGIGMSPDVQTRIFDPLFTTKPFGSGTGLGLTIVRDIINGDFGGTVSVESAPGRGARFTVTLPAKKEKADGEEV